MSAAVKRTRPREGRIEREVCRALPLPLGPKLTGRSAGAFLVEPHRLVGIWRGRSADRKIKLPRVTVMGAAVCYWRAKVCVFGSRRLPNSLRRAAEAPSIALSSWVGRGAPYESPISWTFCRHRRATHSRQGEDAAGDLDPRRLARCDASCPVPGESGDRRCSYLPAGVPPLPPPRPPQF